MRCDNCGVLLPEGEEKKLHDRLVCEDCLMDLLSPVKACANLIKSP